MQGYNIKDVKFENDKEIDKSKLLTGEVIQGLPADSEIVPNSELEKEEYIKFPDGVTQKVVGNGHERGGVKMNIPDGTKVVSKSIVPNKKQVEKLNKDFGLDVSLKDTYAKIIDKYTKKIGLEKLNKEQEEVFEMFEKELQKKGQDQGTARVNREYLSKKINDIENNKKPLEEQRASFFDIVFEMQEDVKKKMKLPAQDEEPEFKYGGVSKKGFEAMCKRMGLDPNKATAQLKAKRSGQTLPEFKDGGIFVKEDDKKMPTGSTLSDTQKDLLVQYYNKYNKPLAEALKTGRLKWEQHVFNPGLLSDLEVRKPEDIQTGYQKRDSDLGLTEAKTYGDLTKERVEGFVLKDYYESKYGKPFSQITDEEIGRLQEEYNEALTPTGYSYYSGVKGDTEVSDRALGNRTSSYMRRVVPLGGKKSGTIDVDRLYGMSEEEINKELEDYGLTYDQIKDYQNAAVKYIEISPEETEETAEEPKTKVEDKKVTYEGKEGNLKDNVKGSPAVNRPKLFFTPDESVLPPTAQEPHLKGDIRFQRIDPIRIGIEPTLQAVAEQREFTSEQLDNLPPSQRAAVMANLAATGQKTISNASMQANMTNAQNISQAELFNIQQAGQEEIYGLNNALNFEQRQLTAQAKTEEAVQQYYDYNRKLGVKNFENMQKLNLLDSLYPDFDLDYFGASVNYNPKSDFMPTVAYTYKNEAGEDVEGTRQITPEEKEAEARNKFASGLFGSGLI
jgi:hypothetical protein